MTVTMTQVDTGLSSETVTNASGSYHFPALDPGGYHLEIRLAGFAPWTRRDLVLSVGQGVTIDVTLELAGTGDAKVPLDTPNGALALGHAGVFGYGTFEDIVPRGWLVRFDLKGGASEKLDSDGTAFDVALDRTGTMVAAGGLDGIVRIGPVSGGEPHLFFGHKGLVETVAFSPDGRWLASAGADRTVRPWPVPDVTKTPPHKRNREEFLAMVRSWTNLRVVPDESSSTGWKRDVGTFPGWANLPVNLSAVTYLDDGNR